MKNGVLQTSSIWLKDNFFFVSYSIYYIFVSDFKKEIITCSQQQANKEPIKMVFFSPDKIDTNFSSKTELTDRNH